MRGKSCMGKPVENIWEDTRRSILVKIFLVSGTVQSLVILNLKVKVSRVFCATPTRGLIYAETVKGIKDNLDPTEDDWLILSGLSMPDCFNTAVREFLKTSHHYLWFVEEDNEAPPGCLNQMLSEALQGHKIVTVDYSVGKGVSHIHKDKNGNPLWCGIGNTLIDREVLENLSDPWFRVDLQMNLDTSEFIKIPENAVKRGFGGHDVYFFTMARQQGYNIRVLPGIVGKHFRATQIDKRETNNGCYTIESI